MKLKPVYRLLCHVCLLLCCQAGNTQVSPDLQALAQHPQWLALLHMRPALDGALRSEADEPSFFLSGTTDDPVAELEATLQSLRSDRTGEHSAWCVFPARANWLSGYFDVQRPAGLACAGLQKWRAQFQRDHLVIVFPAMYMHNPASVFGHTFFRFDAADKQRHPVPLSTAMSYYAAVGSAGGTLNYIGQGLSGGFDGVFEIRPYFEKIRKYSDNEDRDLWEYELDMSAGDIAQLIDHVWEVRGHTFHYFFMDENCSYRLISILDVVLAPHNMRMDLHGDVMPLDTLQLLARRNLVRKASYVPSSVRQFRQGYASINGLQKKQFDMWVEGRSPVEALDEITLKKAALPFSAVKLRQDDRNGAPYKDVLQRVLARSEVAQIEESSAPVVISPPDPVSHSHGKRRVRAGWVFGEGKPAMNVGARLLYHDEMDPLPGFDRGARVEVLDTNWIVEDDELDLEHITWFAIKSRKPRSLFFQPASWGFSWSRRHEWLERDKELVHALDAERGVSCACRAWLCHAEFVGAVLMGGPVDQGWAASGGVRIGALYQSSDWSLALDTSYMEYLSGGYQARKGASIQVGRRLQKDWAADARLEWQDNGELSQEVFSVGLRHFF
jgi:hypothetical protein